MTTARGHYVTSVKHDRLRHLHTVSWMYILKYDKKEVESVIMIIIGWKSNQDGKKGEERLVNGYKVI